MAENFQAYIKDGVAKLIYDETIDVKDVGHVKVDRVSDVVWSEELQCWRVVWQENRMLTLKGESPYFESRVEAIAWEVEQIHRAFEQAHNIVGDDVPY